MTVVVAGAGFGKSSLLAQAVDENALAPRGDDCWLGCGPGDDDPWPHPRDAATAQRSRIRSNRGVGQKVRAAPRDWTAIRARNVG